jgi:hypothetical protein
VRESRGCASANSGKKRRRASFCNGDMFVDRGDVFYSAHGSSAMLLDVRVELAYDGRENYNHAEGSKYICFSLCSPSSLSMYARGTDKGGWNICSAPFLCCMDTNKRCCKGQSYLLPLFACLFVRVRLSFDDQSASARSPHLVSRT